MDTAHTPNLDALCRFSTTGWMTASNQRSFDEVQRFDSLTDLRSLAITNHPAQCALEKVFAFDRYETVTGLTGFDDVLESNWDAFDFFYIHLNGEHGAELEGSTIKASEWVEMVDAWLPGVLGRFKPEVFALSGDLDAVLSEDASIPTMIHSPRIKAHSCWGFSRQGFQDGRPDKEMDLRQWLIFLMAHSSRQESYRAALEIFSR